jgi:hypothetical protein
MKKALMPLLVLAASLFAASGCGGSSDVAPPPPSVTFSISNNGLSSHCGGSAVPWGVASITLKQSVTGVESTQGGTVPSGYSRDIAVLIPANDTYDVFINSESYCCNPGSGCAFDSAIFKKTSLVSGSTHTIALSGGTASTFDSTPSTGIF